MTPYQAYVYNKAHRIFAVSNFTKSKLEDIGVCADKIYVFNNGIEIDRFGSERKHHQIIEDLDLEDKKIILTVSWLTERKGQDMVIRSLPEVLKEFDNVVYLISGVGPAEKKLKSITDSLSLQNNVKFLGYVSDEEIVSLYNRCDVFIMASRQIENSVEGFGIVFLEANACRKPVIAGNSGGISDAVVDGVTGLMVDPLNPNDIAQAIIRLLSDKELSETLGNNGVEVQGVVDKRKDLVLCTL
jgi:phosphatidylinositol alpha-1,6-mannosyltransferase